MEWSRAKKYTVIALIILNLFLLCLNVYKGLDTRLGYERINDLTALINLKGITITGSLPKNYKPMAEIAVSDYNFDFVKLQNIFMSEEADVKRTDEYNSVVFMSENSRLSVRGSGVNFTTVKKNGFSSESDIRAYTDGVIKKINSDFGNYKFHSIEKSNDSYTIRYYERCKGKNVFSNFADFIIKGENVAFALNYVKIGNEINESKNIYAADEAIYSVIDEIKEDMEKGTITNVELGYYVISSSAGGEKYATPFYIVKAGGKDYYVNAYTGECF